MFTLAIAHIWGSSVFVLIAKCSLVPLPCFWKVFLVTDLQNAESVVFPQGLTDHIVTVTTQPADGETESLEMTHDILGAEGESVYQSFYQVIRVIICPLSQVSAAHFKLCINFV